MAKLLVHNQTCPMHCSRCWPVWVPGETKSGIWLPFCRRLLNRIAQWHGAANFREGDPTYGPKSKFTGRWGTGGGGEGIRRNSKSWNWQIEIFLYLISLMNRLSQVLARLQKLVRRWWQLGKLCTGLFHLSLISSAKILQGRLTAPNIKCFVFSLSYKKSVQRREEENVDNWKKARMISVLLRMG